MSRKSGRASPGRCFSAALDNSPSRQEEAQLFICESKDLGIRAWRGSLLGTVSLASLPQIIHPHLTEHFSFSHGLLVCRDDRNLMKGLSLAFHRPPMHKVGVHDAG